MPSHSVCFEVLPSDSLFAESSTYKGLFYNSMRRSVRLAFLDWMIKNSIDDTTTI